MAHRRRLPKFLTPEDAERLLAAASTQRDRVLIFCCLLLGLRVSEACMLRVEDIDFSQRIVQVIAGKGDKDRNLPLAARLDPPLREWIGVRRDGWLFPSRKRPGQPIGPRVVQMMVKDLGVKAGIVRKVTPHCLRHTFATTLLHRGVSLREIQALLGHSSLSVTEIYTWVMPDMLRSAVDRL